MDPIRVLIVDDSPFMRKALERMLVAAEDIQVVGSARDGLDALDKIKELKPDIVTLDVEMPRMDGLACLKRIMVECPLPVLMVSSLTQEGAAATLDALAFGALDFTSTCTPAAHSALSHCALRTLSAPPLRRHMLPSESERRNSICLNSGRVLRTSWSILGARNGPLLT